MKKTNAIRQLDINKISYEVRDYEVDESDLSAVTAAKKLGLPIEQVFKTLVVHGDKTGVFLAVIPGEEELDLKAAAAVTENKKVEMAALKDVLPLTGYIRGGVSPIGTKKPYPVYIHESAFDFPLISISAGHRGMQVLLSPHDVVKMTDAKPAKLIKTSE